MTRVTLIDPAEATGPAADRLAEIKSAFGVVKDVPRD